MITLKCVKDNLSVHFCVNCLVIKLQKYVAGASEAHRPCELRHRKRKMTHPVFFFPETGSLFESVNLDHLDES